VHPLDDAFRDSKRDIAPLEARFLVTPFHDARFLEEYTADRLFTEPPKLREFADGIVPFKRQITRSGLSRNGASVGEREIPGLPIPFNGRLDRAPS
jgi:hypothetical protein